MPPPTPSNPCPERPSRRGRMRKRKCVANAILSAGKPLHVTSASLKMRARAGLVQAALVGELPLELSARGRGAYAGLHAVFRLRREARELGLSGLAPAPRPRSAVPRSYLFAQNPFDRWRGSCRSGSTRRVRFGLADSRWTARVARRSNWEPQRQRQKPPSRPEDSRWRGKESHHVS
jgi:hypothetical protein